MHRGDNDMTWTRDKVVKIERKNDQLQVTGWEGRRHCGCEYIQGVTIGTDPQEQTFGASPCAEHGAQMRRALDHVRHMPPSEEQMHLLFQRLLDQEIDPWLATV